MVILNASDPENAKKMDSIIKNADHVFILVYMVGCGPCNATRPEWKKMSQALKNKYSSNNNIAILDLDSKFMKEVSGIGEISGFPTMKYIGNNGKIVESYEDSDIPNKERISDSFITWIDSKVLNSRTINPSQKLNVYDLSKKLSSKQLNSAKPMIMNSKLTQPQSNKKKSIKYKKRINRLKNKSSKRKSSKRKSSKRKSRSKSKNKLKSKNNKRN
jgi:thiol-disulfide isomerase/thioredoxin